MREIKFRAWDTYWHKMLGPFDIDEILSMENGPGKDTEFVSRPYWLQFTGLRDKNGKEIYEGDIVRNDDKYNTVVKWTAGEDDEAQNYIAGFWLNYEPDDLEVIGNIYGNPDLLKDKT